MCTRWVLSCTHACSILERVRTGPASLQLVEEQLKGTSELASFMAGLSQEIKVRTGAPCWLVSTAPPPPPPLQSSSAPGKQYRTSLVNALTLHLGTQAIDYLHSHNTTPSVTTVIKTTHFALYKQMILELDTEGLSRSIAC